MPVFFTFPIFLTHVAQFYNKDIDFIQAHGCPTRCWRGGAARRSAVAETSSLPPPTDFSGPLPSCVTTLLTMPPFRLPPFYHSLSLSRYHPLPLAIVPPPDLRSQLPFPTIPCFSAALNEPQIFSSPFYLHYFRFVTFCPPLFLNVSNLNFIYIFKTLRVFTFVRLRFRKPLNRFASDLF